MWPIDNIVKEHVEGEVQLNDEGNINKLNVSCLFDPAEETKVKMTLGKCWLINLVSMTGSVRIMMARQRCLPTTLTCQA